jgi:hypothetical protein
MKMSGCCWRRSTNGCSIETSSHRRMEIWNRSMGIANLRSMEMPERWKARRGRPWTVLKTGWETALTMAKSSGAACSGAPAGLFSGRPGQARAGAALPVSVPARPAPVLPALALPVPVSRLVGRSQLSADGRASGPIAATQPRAQSFRCPSSGKDLVICPAVTGKFEAPAGLPRLLSDCGAICARSSYRANR